MTTTTTIAKRPSPSMRRKLLTSSKVFTSRKMYITLLFFMLVQIILAPAQIGENDASFNTKDQTLTQGANGLVNAMLVQSDDKIIIGGNFSLYNGMPAPGLARLTKNGKIDLSFYNGAGVDNIISMALQPDDKIIVVSDDAARGVYEIQRLHSNGRFDGSFYWSETNGPILHTIIQPDGKVLAAGNFSTYNYNSDSANCLIRLLSNGEVDPTFHAVITDTLFNINQIALQPDGKIIAVGHSIQEEISYLFVIRLNADGSRDYTFETELIRIAYDGRSATRFFIEVENTGNILFAFAIDEDFMGDRTDLYGYLIRYAPNGEVLSNLREIYVTAMKLQPDGKIVLAGSETLGSTYNSSYFKKQVIQLNTDLTVDTSFSFVDNHAYDNVVDGYNPFLQSIQGEITTAAFQSDGKIILGGDFSDFNGLIENGVARINADGSFDHTFNKRSGCDGSIFASATQTNGKTIIGGEFSRYNFNVVPNIARLRTNGRLDHTFDPGTGTNGKIYTIALTANHKYLIGGDFTSYDGHACHNIVRLFGDGSIDLGFSAQTDDIVRKITIAKDGKIIIAGNFDHVNGTSSIAIARLNENGTLDYGFTSPITDTLAEVSDCKISKSGEIYAAVNYRESDANILPNFFGNSILRLSNTGSINISYVTWPLYEINTITFNNSGKLLAGGSSGYYRYQQGSIVQLNSDGSIDLSFDSEGLLDYLDKPVRTIDVLKNNKIIIGGDFTNHIRLLNADGSINSNFLQNADDNIYTTTVTEDNKLIIAGIFNEYSYDVRNSIARIDLGEWSEHFDMKDASQPTNELSLNIYPNPANSEINLNNLVPGSVIRIYNSLGKEIYTEILTNNSSTIELSDYSNGIYFLISENNGVRNSTKFMVSK